jgi:hypothetical protein
MYTERVYTETISLVQKENVSITTTSDNCGDGDNNLIKFFIIYMPSQQPQGQLQTQHSVDRSNYT